MPKEPQAAALQVNTSDYDSLGHVAKLLGRSKAFVKLAVDKGLLRSSTAPFRSNLNPEAISHMVLVNLQDVRDAISGKIDLTSLDTVRKVCRKDLPADMIEFAERFVNLEQTVEQVAVMVSTVLELQNTGVTTKKKREVPCDHV